MNEIKKQVSELKETWDKVYKIAVNNPSGWQPYLPNCSLEILNESVDIINFWLAKTKAPNGFSPAFHLAKSVAALNLGQLISTAKLLETGQYTHFPNFSNYINSVISALHTMAAFSEKSDVKETNANMTAELSQSIALLKTAQKELAKKLESLELATKLATEIESSHLKIAEIQGDSETVSEKIQQSLKDSEEAETKTLEILSNCESTKDDIEALLEENKKLHASIVKANEQLASLQKDNEKQNEIINSVLPKAASAGLASAFSERVGKLNSSKWIWMGLFVLSLLSLSALAAFFVTSQKGGATDLALYVIARLPFTAPLIWLGWFSAIQYGNTIRVQEDYAFKEATSKAFQGYRDHMEHMSKINTDEANTALNLLSVKTIEILSHEPLRIFGKVDNDASPSGKIAELMKSKNNENG